MAAPGTLDFAKMIQNIGDLAELSVTSPLWLLIWALCYILAAVLAIVAAMQLKATADERGMSYRAPIMTFIAACCFAAFPDATSTIGITLFGSDGNNSPLQYVPGTAQTSPFRAVMAVVSLIGVVFFMRGIMEIKRAGEPNRYQNASISRAIFILIGAIAAIHIDLSIKIMANTFQWDVSAYLN